MSVSLFRNYNILKNSTLEEEELSLNHIQQVDKKDKVSKFFLLYGALFAAIERMEKEG